MLEQIARRVADGETVTFRPTGSSMVPLIQSRDEVVVSPVDPTRVEVGDIVLTKVAGNVYIHLVKAIEPAKRRVQIGNNRGGINGWTNFDRVYGIAVSGGRSRAAGNEDQGHSARHGEANGAALIWPLKIVTLVRSGPGWDKPAPSTPQRIGLPKRITFPSGSVMEPSRLPYSSSRGPSTSMPACVHSSATRSASWQWM